MEVEGSMSFVTIDHTYTNRKKYLTYNAIKLQILSANNSTYLKSVYSKLLKITYKAYEPQCTRNNDIKSTRVLSFIS